MLNSNVLWEIEIAAFMQALWEDANGRRHDELGAKPRTRLGYGRLLLAHLKVARCDLLSRLRFYYNNELPVY